MNANLQQEVISLFEHRHLNDEDFDLVKGGDYRKWNALRRIYSRSDLSRYTPYIVDWTKIFTPIESDVWCSIRYAGIPMYPQFPIGKYFADFADPIKKIVIECDGAQWHDPVKDELRDIAMSKDGWTVYRISGRECRKTPPDLARLHYNKHNIDKSILNECAHFILANHAGASHG